jgi:N utilization substance protein A
VATRKYYKTQENLRAELDKEYRQDQCVHAVKTWWKLRSRWKIRLQITLEDARKVDPALEVGGELLIPKVTEGILGRIAAQLAKQVIFQKVREAERDTVYNEYIGKRGRNRQRDGEAGRRSGCDSRHRQGRSPHAAQGAVAAGIVRDRRARSSCDRARGKARKARAWWFARRPELVQHLFQTEVPEIYDGTVVIRAIAREAGERTKIAVMSKDKDVDAVGACVGMKGMRVQSIIRELRGEKIDIIEYHEDAVTFAEKALQPAKVSKVTMSIAADKHLEVVVDDSQLSLAIGKKGQNVRLAAKLLGWKIDIKSEEEKRQEVEQQMSALVAADRRLRSESVPGTGRRTGRETGAAGITTVKRWPI